MAPRKKQNATKSSTAKAAASKPITAESHATNASVVEPAAAKSSTGNAAATKTGAAKSTAAKASVISPDAPSSSAGKTSVTETRSTRSNATSVSVTNPTATHPSVGALKPKGTGLKKSAMKRFRNKRRDNIKEAGSRPAIRRLALRGGVKRMSATVYDGTRVALKERLEAIIGKVALLVEHRKQVMATSIDVVAALKMQGTTLYGFGWRTPEGIEKPLF